MKQNLQLVGVAISTDDAGRYSLNDLHAASGGNPNHAPAQFMRTEQTKALIEEINCANMHSLGLETVGIPAVKTKEGRNGGTFVVREMVYAYAMWISPAFHLKVIRAYDALIHQQNQLPPLQRKRYNFDNYDFGDDYPQPTLDRRQNSIVNRAVYDLSRQLVPSIRSYMMRKISAYANEMFNPQLPYDSLSYAIHMAIRDSFTEELVYDLREQYC